MLLPASHRPLVQPRRTTRAPSREAGVGTRSSGRAARRRSRLLLSTRCAIRACPAAPGHLALAAKVQIRSSGRPGPEFALGRANLSARKTESRDLPARAVLPRTRLVCQNGRRPLFGRAGERQMSDDSPTSMKRRLAAILAADIAGYSRL